MKELAYELLPDDGAIARLYPAATFPPCRYHPGADVLVALVRSGDDFYFDEPLCAECGRRVVL